MANTADNGTVARPIETGIAATIAGAIVFFGGWSLLVWVGWVQTPVDLKDWWPVPAAFGLYHMLKAFAVNLRNRGEFPEFFAFWGPYRTTAVFYAVIGLVAAYGFIKLPSLASAPHNAKALFLVLAPPAFAFSGLAEVANKRREYPLLAAWDLITWGIIFGSIMGLVCYILYSIVTQGPISGGAIVYWCCSFAILGAIANLWRRHGGSPLGGVLAGMGNASLEIGTTINALVAFVKGSLWLALAGFLIWAVGFPTNIVGMIVVSAGVVAGGKGLVEMGGALHRDEAARTDSPLGDARSASAEETKAAASGTEPKPPWGAHPYRD